MPSDFLVKPLGGMSPAAILEDAISGGKATFRKRKMDEEIPEALQSGDPDRLAEMMIKYPEMANVISGIDKFKSEKTKQSLVDSAKRVLVGGEDPVDVLTKHIGVIDAEGGDASQSITALGQHLAEPGKSPEWAEKILALHAPEEYKQYKATQTGGKDTRTPDVKNYEYARSQGYEGSFLDYQISGKDTTGSTTAIKEFEYGEKNPKFRLQQQKKEEAERLSKVKKVEFKDVAALRKEFLSQSSEFQKVRDSYTRVVGSTLEPSPAGDLSLIFNYMKMLDPGSVVRESEFATAASTGSYGQRIQAAAQKIMSGERLTPEMRADFVEKSGVLYKGMQEQHKKREVSYRKIAADNSFNPEEVVIDITAPEDLPNGVTEEDILATMQANNMTREQVLAKLRAR